jgi:hypothetical protein
MHRPSQDDDLLLPDPAEPTEEVPRNSSGLEWPFSRGETVALGVLYVMPFVISWLVKL